MKPIPPLPIRFLFAPRSVGFKGRRPAVPSGALSSFRRRAAGLLFGGLLCVLFGLAAPAARGCRYTVRDAGFVDLGPAPYRLCVCYDSRTPKSFLATARAFAALGESNVRVDLIDVEKDRDDPAVRRLEEEGGSSLPVALLGAPDGRFLVLDGLGPGLSGGGAAWSFLEKVVSSPVREEILRHIIDSYCVILLVEGEDDGANKAARDLAFAAAKRVEGMIPSMDKPVNRPPRVVVLPFEDAPDEGILLFGLGLDGADSERPAVAVLYGRGRRSGPVLAGDTLSEKSLLHILLVVGADCECGLDRAWMQGPMIPLRWDEETRAGAAKVLGFDPDNPMVRMEVGQIVLRCPGAAAAGGDGAQGAARDGEDLLIGYSEEVVDFGKEGSAAGGGGGAAGAAKAAPGGSAGAVAGRGPESGSAPGDGAAPRPLAAGGGAPEDVSPLYRDALYSAAGLAFIVLAGAVLIVVRAWKRGG